MDDFYESFWELPRVPVPLPGPMANANAPEALTQAREALRHALMALEADETVVGSSASPLDVASAAVRDYIRELRRAGIGSDATGSSTWRSAVLGEDVEIPLAFDEPMALLLLATLSLRHGLAAAERRSPEVIAAAARHFCQAAGIAQYVIALEDHISTARRSDIPTAMPDLFVRVVEELVQVAVGLAQQLAIVKAALYFETPYSKAVLQKLHAGCHVAFASYEAVVVQSSYQASPLRHPGTLLGYTAVFARLHRAMALQLEAELAYEDREVGEALAMIAAAEHHLHVRQSMRDIGLPPLSGHLQAALEPTLVTKRQELAERRAQYTKENDSIYFAIVPTEADVLALELPHVFIMKAAPFDPTLPAVLANGDMEFPDPTSVDSADVVAILEEPSGSSSSLSSDDANGDANEDVVATTGLLVTIDDVVAESRQALGPTRPPPTPPRGPDTSPIEPRALEELVPTPIVPSTGDEDLATTAVAATKKIEAEAAQRMRAAMAHGLPAFCQSSRGKWLPVLLRLEASGLVLTRKKALALFKHETRLPWSSLSAVQLEHQLAAQQPRLAALQGLDPSAASSGSVSSILLVARRVERVETIELTLGTAELNAAAVTCLQGAVREQQQQQQQQQQQRSAEPAPGACVS